MACKTVLPCAFLTEPYRPLHQHNRALVFLPFTAVGSTSSASLIRSNYGTIRARNLHSAGRSHLNCSHYESQSSSQDGSEQGPPQEAVLKAISVVEPPMGERKNPEISYVYYKIMKSLVSKTEGRVGQTTNVVIGGTVADDSTNEWVALDKKVNSYPTVRGFTAIGTGGDDFVHAMVVAVESVIQKPIPEGHVKQKVSSRGKYVSVNIGPIQVSSSEQVQAVYNAMKRDERMKYFL